MKLHARHLALGAALLALAGGPALLAAPATVPASAEATDTAFVQLKPGDTAPDFTVQGPDGQPVKLSDFRGKVVVVDVSATWCGPCQAAMPNNDRVYRKYADQGVVLLGVTADDSKANYERWLKTNDQRYAFTMTYDPAGRKDWKDSVFNTGYHVTGFPTMFVIRPDGKVSEIVSGGGPGIDHRLEYALARAGVKVDLASLPPEEKPTGPSVIPAMTKTPAMTIAKPATQGAKMIGFGAPAGGGMHFGDIKRGTPVADFAVTAPDGHTIHLSDFKGKVVLVSFFLKQGPSPRLEELYKRYQDQGLVVLGIFSASTKADFEQWLAQHKGTVTYPVTWDSTGPDWAQNISNTAFGIGLFPFTGVVDREGRAVDGAGGFLNNASGWAKLLRSVAESGIKLTPEDMIAGKLAVAAATIQPHPAAPGGMTEAKQIPTLGAGAVAPDFTSHTLDGKAVTLADYKGKVVILDFWATWCGPCMASMPHTQKLAATYKDQGVVVLASCTSDTTKAFQAWVKANQAKYPDIQFTTDPHERGSTSFDERASAKLYHVVGIPTQFIIGRDGKIVRTLVGYDQGDERAAAALAEAGVKVDPALVAQGRKQLQEEAAQEAQQAKEAVEHPRPPFEENFARIKAGQTVPDFTVQTPDGKTARFSDYAKGKTVIFDFWAPWCGPCQMAMPELEKTYQKYKDQGVVVLGLCCFDTRENYDKWLKTQGPKYTFPTVFDPAGKPDLPNRAQLEAMTPEQRAAAEATAKHYYQSVIATKVFGAFPMLPTTLVIDREGKLVGTYAGYRKGKNEALGNLLLRAGIKLTADDMPDKIWTHAETQAPAPEPAVAAIKVGAMAPDFAAVDVNGSPVHLSDFKGKTVVLDFWATWCGPCMASMPHTAKVAADYKDQGVVVVGSCTSDTRANFDKWVKANQAKYADIHFSYDPAGRGADRASYKLYGVEGIPMQFIIGPDGRIVSTVIGYRQGERLLEGALAKAGIKVAPDVLAQARKDQAARDVM